MAVWCAALALGCVLAGLSGFALDWGRAQLDTGAALCADTLRLHIKADSDSLLDQTAKLAVRDALLAYTDAQCRASTQPEALHWAAQNLPALELTARQTLARLGLAPAARVELVNMYFAATRYQNAALPAGRYDAVRLTLGENDRSGKTGGACSTRASAARPAAAMPSRRRMTSSAGSTSSGSGWWTGCRAFAPTAPTAHSSPLPHNLWRKGV